MQVFVGGLLGQSRRSINVSRKLVTWSTPSLQKACMDDDIQLEAGSSPPVSEGARNSNSVSYSKAPRNNFHVERTSSETPLINRTSRSLSSLIASALSSKAARRGWINLSCTNVLLCLLLVVQCLAMASFGTAGGAAALSWLTSGFNIPFDFSPIPDCTAENAGYNASLANRSRASGAGALSAPDDETYDEELECTEVFRSAIRRTPYSQQLQDMLTLVTHQLTERVQMQHRLQPPAHMLTSADIIRERVDAYAGCPRDVPNLPKLAVCSLQHSTGQVVQEWVAHYLLLGASKVFIYDNSQQGTVAYDVFREAVAPFVESGHVAVVDWHFQGGFPRNLHMAFDDCRNRHRAQFDWIAFLDSDEFVVIHPPAAPCLPLYLTKFTEFPGLAIQWRVMTPLGVARHDPKKLFLEQYLWEVKDRNSANMGLVKTIAQPKLATMTLSPHHQAYVDGRSAVSWNRDVIWGALMGMNYPEPYKEIEVRHFWAGDWETGFLEKVCSQVLERVQLRYERARILLEWMDPACCESLAEQTREEAMLRNFIYGPPVDAEHP